MHPTAKMAKVVVHGIVAVVSIGMNEAAVSGKKRLRKVLAAAGGEVEEGIRILRVPEVQPRVGGSSGPQEQKGRIVGVDCERLGKKRGRSSFFLTRGERLLKNPPTSDGVPVAGELGLQIPFPDATGASQGGG
jgi:hypothetical protein